MTRTPLLTLLLTLAVLVGCNSGSDSDPNSTTAPADGTASASNDESPGIAAAVPPTNETVDVAEIDAPAADGTDESAAPTQVDYEQKLMAAVAQTDMQAALDIVQAALADFPEDVGMQVNRVLLHLSLGAQMEPDDMDGAAAKFVEAGTLARDLQKLDEELPPQGKQAVLYGLMSEARGFAHQEKIDEALQSLREAAEGGLARFSFDDDEFFARVRDNEDFKNGIATLMKDEAQRGFDATESFAFDFDLEDLDKNPIKLSDFEGKIVIVDFWGTWCPPCREEVPHFVKLKENYADDLAVVGINYENGEGEEVIATIRKFSDDHEMNYPCVVGDQATQDQVNGLDAFPTTLFLDRQGKVRLKLVGYHPYEMLEAYLNVLLDEGKSEDSAG